MPEKKGRAPLGAKKPMAACPWVHLNPHTCLPCGQTTHCVDKDSEPHSPQWLKWTKTKKKQNTKGKWVLHPAGEECAHCLNRRRGNFTEVNEETGEEEVMPLSRLMELRAAEASVEEKWSVGRRHRVRGEKDMVKGPGAKVNATELLKDKKAYRKRYKSGRFEHLADFCKDRGIPYGLDVDKAFMDGLCDHIKDKYGLEVVEDEDKNLGVNFYNERKQSYCFEQGMESSFTVRKRSEADAGEAKAIFAEKLAAMQVKWNVPQAERQAMHLDDAAMNEVSQALCGLHDFAAFCRPKPGATTIRHLTHFAWTRDAAGILTGSVIADAFCHSMVRSLGVLHMERAGGRTPWLFRLCPPPPTHALPATG